MRVTPLVGSKLWFGPRDDGLGWGWRPLSWEGYLVTVAYLVTVVGYTYLLHGDHGWLVIAGSTFALVVVCVLKGSTPGGSRQAAKMPSRGG